MGGGREYEHWKTVASKAFLATDAGGGIVGSAGTGGTTDRGAGRGIWIAGQGMARGMHRPDPQTAGVGTNKTCHCRYPGGPDGGFCGAGAGLLRQGLSQGVEQPECEPCFF